MWGEGEHLGVQRFLWGTGCQQDKNALTQRVWVLNQKLQEDDGFCWVLQIFVASEPQSLRYTLSGQSWYASSCTQHEQITYCIAVSIPLSIITKSKKNKSQSVDCWLISNFKWKLPEFCVSLQDGCYCSLPTYICSADRSCTIKSTHRRHVAKSRRTCSRGCSMMQFIKKS